MVVKISFFKPVSHSSILNCLFLSDDHWITSAKISGLSFTEADFVISNLLSDKEKRKIILETTRLKLLPSLTIFPDIETLRVFIVISIIIHFVIEGFDNESENWDQNFEIVSYFAQKFCAMQGGGAKVLKYWSGYLSNSL